ncbi:hypothetical protein QYE76_007995 [Lolium multiflorum]|uniref:Uncharacterized protein n=1 Tax=Lolium multiflorum TaxID=4521 RepID=A0AAD8UYD4_LOLMU|nr:hypothetical protein QYE76_007995 [Lolium multiflorum]
MAAALEGFAYHGFLCASSSLATTSSELENLRSSYQELEIKLKEAEQQKERAEKQLAEKNSELIREKGEFMLKRNADSETIKRQQKELNGLRKYMETTEHHWDLLAKNILEPLGYPERRRNKFPRDDVLSLAGDDCKDLISAVTEEEPHLRSAQTDQANGHSSGAGNRSTSMSALLDAVSGYDTRIARRIRHDEFYDKAVLPADEPLEDELQKERDAEAVNGMQTDSWTGSRMLPKRNQTSDAPEKMKRQ